MEQTAYLLDTNIITALVRNPHGPVFDRLRALETPVHQHYGEIRAYLTQRGQPIGPNDLFIAAHARALGMTLVTDKLREFERVPGLKLENWLVAAY
jgi:predicted nucleic acid-binding protein